MPEKRSRGRAVNYYNRVHTVEEPFHFGVPQPTLYKVPVHKYEYVPVKEPCDPCGGPGPGGDLDIQNHTNVNYFKGKTEDDVQIINNRGRPKPPSNKPKDWNEVLNRFA